MATLPGRINVIKVGNSASPEVFTAIGAIRESTISLGDADVDITNFGSAGWRTYHAGNVMQSVTLTCNGFVNDDIQLRTIREARKNGTLLNYNAVIGGTSTTGTGVVLSGKFRVTTFEVSASFDNVAEYSLTLESSGTITFTDTTTTS